MSLIHTCPNCGKKCDSISLQKHSCEVHLIQVLESACEYDNVSAVTEARLKALIRLGQWAEMSIIPALKSDQAGGDRFDVDAALKTAPVTVSE